MRKRAVTSAIAYVSAKLRIHRGLVVPADLWGVNGYS